jgi:peptidoglycan hydrolase-like protein with peptidoglycan-binding domain
MPLPRTSRPAEVIEEKMIISPTDIRRAQEALRAKGLKPGDDGRLDEETQEALAKFQKQNSLPATGVLDDKTAREAWHRFASERN